MDVGFFLKKLLSQLFMPIPLICVCLLIALCFHQWRRLLLTTALLLVIGFSSSWGSYQLARLLEQQYQVNQTPMTQSCAIILLGAGMDEQVQGQAQHQLSPAGALRLQEALRQWQLAHEQQCLLITSGWGGDLNQQSYADVVAQAAIDQGFPKERIVQFPLAKDTGDEAKALKAYLNASDIHQQSTLRLVTSAMHMPRAMHIYQSAGLVVQAAPTDFRGRRSLWWQLSAENLLTSQRAIHEYMGLVWYRLKDTISFL